MHTIIHFVIYYWQWLFFLIKYIIMILTLLFPSLKLIATCKN